MPRKRTETVSFRADEDLLRLLDQSRSRFGVSRGEWVRGVVQANLYATEHESLNERLSDIEQAVARILSRQEAFSLNQARSLYAILTLTGNLSADDAKAVVQTNITR
ncbi:MAG: hypothetical protein KF708_07985 [Pirellulales bacterium]|nr:hypothetical protein [Pirellulales bacterium]